MNICRSINADCSLSTMIMGNLLSMLDKDAVSQGYWPFFISWLFSILNKMTDKIKIK